MENAYVLCFFLQVPDVHLAHEAQICLLTSKCPFQVNITGISKNKSIKKKTSSLPILLPIA